MLHDEEKKKRENLALRKTRRKVDGLDISALGLACLVMVKVRASLYMNFAAGLGMEGIENVGY